MTQKLLESLFGPESSPIDVAAFQSSAFTQQSACTASLERKWALSPEERKVALANECSVDSMKNALEETWGNPTLSSFMLKEHDHVLAGLIQTSKKVGREAHSPNTLQREVRALHESMGGIKLSSWTLSPNTDIFIRTSKNSDQNAFGTLKFKESGSMIETQQEAVVVMAVYNKVPWSPCYVSRSSRLAFLSSQTLSDLCAAIPCSPHATRVASAAEGSVRHYEIIKNATTSDRVLCVGGLAYGDAKEGDYADKLIAHISVTSRSKTHIQRAPVTLGEALISSSSFRINEPYWMLHHGNCEHFIVVEQMRLLHPSDPRSGYPITLQQTPQMLDICRACAKSPAVWSIVGDTRLGESPSFLCAPCWKSMGAPDESEALRVEVIPLFAL